MLLFLHLSFTLLVSLDSKFHLLFTFSNLERDARASHWFPSFLPPTLPPRGRTFCSLTFMPFVSHAKCPGTSPPSTFATSCPRLVYSTESSPPVYPWFRPELGHFSPFSCAPLTLYAGVGGVIIPFSLAGADEIEILCGCSPVSFPGSFRHLLFTQFDTPQILIPTLPWATANAFDFSCN